MASTSVSTPSQSSQKVAHLGKRWAGRILTAVPVVMMLFSAAMKLTRQQQIVEQFVGRFGYAETALTGIAVLEIACIVLYAIPRTAILGAVLLTGYLGGAIATHVRVGDAGFVVPLVLGLFVWAGLYFRDDRFRALVPLRRTQAIAGQHGIQDRSRTSPVE